MMQDKDDDNIDELDDGFESEHEDSNAFTIRGVLQPPAAESFTTKELHSEPNSRPYSSGSALKTVLSRTDPPRIH
jgi:hypothetical protein